MRIEFIKKEKKKEKYYQYSKLIQKIKIITNIKVTIIVKIYDKYQNIR